MTLWNEEVGEAKLTKGIMYHGGAFQDTLTVP